MQKKYNTLAVFIAACAGMGFFGVTMLSLGPILGQLNSIVEGANALPSTMSIGIIIGIALFGPIVDKFGYKWLLIISSALALLGVQGVAQFSQIGLLHASIACLGLGGGFLNGLTNALVADIYDDDKRGGKLGILGAFYCIGALLWTLMNYFIADFHMPLYALSVIMAGFIVYFCFIAFPQAKSSSEEVSIKKSLGMLKYPALILFALVLFFESGLEGASGSFTVEFFTQSGTMSAKAATLAMTWFTIGMLAGRLPLGYITSKIKETGTLYTYLGVALVGVVVFWLAKSPVAAYAAMALLGFGVGATYPVILNFIAVAFRDLSGTAMSVALFIALLGQYCFNSIAGAAFKAGSIGILPILLVAAVVAMMCLVPIGQRAAGKMSKKA